MIDTLAAALATFATCRSALLTDVIVELGRASASSFLPAKERTNYGFHKRWIEAAQDPEKRSWSLAHLTTQLPKLLDGEEHGSGDKCEALAERLQVLVKAPPDPRIWRAMLDLYERNEPVAGFTIVDDLMMELLVLHADDATGATLKALKNPYADLTGLEFPGKVTLTDSERKAFAASARPARRDVSALFAAVLEDPDDDDARMVLSDALQEAGDPRGELIALQLREAQGEASDPDIERAQELVKAHGKEWLGALRPIVYRAELRRGFLWQIELAGSWSTRTWSKHAADPMLATVERLLDGQAKSPQVVEFLRGPVVVKNLRAIHVSDDLVWNALRENFPAKLDTLHCFGWRRGDYEKSFVEKVLPLLEENPKITTVGCDLAMLPRFTKTLAARVRRLVCRAEVKAAVAVWNEHPKLQSLEFGWTNPVELVRQGKRERVIVRPSRLLKTAGTELAALPKSVIEIEVIGNASFAKRAAEHFKKRFRFVERPAPSGAITGVKV